SRWSSDPYRTAGPWTRAATATGGRGGAATGTRAAARPGTRPAAARGRPEPPPGTRAGPARRDPSGLGLQGAAGGRPVHARRVGLDTAHGLVVLHRGLGRLVVGAVERSRL